MDGYASKYKFYHDKMPDKKEFLKGCEVETEHVIFSNYRVPIENLVITVMNITLDHLTEIPDYYERLEKMEEQAKLEGMYTEVEIEPKRKYIKKTILRECERFYDNELIKENEVN